MLRYETKSPEPYMPAGALDGNTEKRKAPAGTQKHQQSSLVGRRCKFLLSDRSSTRNFSNVLAVNLIRLRAVFVKHREQIQPPKAVLLLHLDDKNGTPCFREDVLDALQTVALLSALRISSAGNSAGARGDVAIAKMKTEEERKKSSLRYEEVYDAESPPLRIRRVELLLCH
ncbi:MAG: hypothetical protein IJB29_03355 [Mailhella sp.]|nr:hypothetical protein [Mailhella sp.]